MTNFSSSLLGRLLIPVTIAAIAIMGAVWLLAPDNLIATILAVVALIAVFIVSLQTIVMNRLTTLERHITLVASGETAPSGALHDESTDELAMIGKTMNSFVENLSEAIEDIRNNAQRVLQSADDQAQKMEGALSQLQTSSSEAENTAESINQITVTSTNLSENTTLITSTIDEALESLELGTAASSANQTSMGELVNTVESMSENVARLQEESAQIGSVLDVIGGIAEQTNLLALNAAIEAARAGEQGRGFAVVADEVRALAHRTQDSTGEIQTMVEGLQDKAQSAVKAMEQGRQLSSNSLEQSQQVEEVLQRVQAVVAQVNTLVTDIADSATVQTSATTTINAQMAGIAQQIRDASEGLGVIAENAHDQQEIARQVDTVLQRICV